MAIILSNFNRFSKYFSLEDSLVNLQQSRVVNNQSKTGLLLTLSVKKNLKLQARALLSYALCAPG